MLRASVWGLTALLLFGLVFALWPAAPSLRGSGVTLQDVKLRLYPAQDASAEWRFAAREIRVDPEKGETSLDQLGTGERWVRAEPATPPVQVAPPAALHLDMTIKADQLVIDGQDNLHANTAELYTLADCSTFTLSAQNDQQVVINQQGGYTAPRGQIRSPIYSGTFKDITANFDFSDFRAEQDPGAELRTAPPTRCVGGKIQAR